MSNDLFIWTNPSCDLRPEYTRPGSRYFWFNGSVCFVLKFEFPPSSPSPLWSANIKTYTEVWNFDPIKNLTPVIYNDTVAVGVEKWILDSCTLPGTLIINVTGGKESVCPTQPCKSDLSTEQKILKCGGSLASSSYFGWVQGLMDRKQWMPL